MVAEEAPASTHCSRRTRDQPDLTHCHGCAAGFSGRSRLRALPSEWRIVLLCSICLSALRSRLICSYCLRPISTAASAAPAARDFIDCGRCSARIHLRCVPREQRYFSLSDLTPATASVFSCVDCCALPKLLSLFPKPSQDFSPEVACKALNAPAVVKIGAGKKMDGRKQSDEELALKLHLAMNGSRRILRDRPPKINGDVNFRKNNINNNSNCNGAQLCTEAEGTSSSGGSCEQQQRSSSAASQQEEWRSRDDRYLIKYGRRKNRYLKKYSRKKLRSADTIIKDGCVLVPCSQNCSPELCRLTPNSSGLPSMVHLDASAHVVDVSICQL